MTAIDLQLDLDSLKRRQQATWASGNYAAVAARIPIVAERLCDAADLRAGDRVLDVATGSGNAALAAARCGCDVTGVDFVPGLLERARIRAVAEGLDAEFQVGDAERLPFPDSSFDAVTSVFGVMFAPNQERAAAELLRVCRPGGIIALANWTPDGFLGELFRVTRRHVAAPAGAPDPMRWGTEEGIRELLGEDLAGLLIQRRTYTFRFRSAGEFVEFFRINYGPTLSAFGALDASGGQRLAAEIAATVTRHDRRGGNGPVAIPGTYLEILAIRQ